MIAVPPRAAPLADRAAGSVAAAIAAAATRLHGAGVDTARLDAEVLVARAAGWSRAGLFARLSENLTDAAAARLEESLARRCRREPLAYITGEKEFYSLSLAVSPAVLIPRPETEMLVDEALRRLPRGGRAVDVGTGSGCIAIAVAVHRRDVRLCACDLSAPALAVAAANAARHGVADRIDFVRGDLLTALRGGEVFDLVVANPPYVADGEVVAAELAHEPRQALRAGADGMAAIARLVSQARAVLRPAGELVFELGSGQEAAVRRVLAQAGFSTVDVARDLAGHPRVAIAALGAVGK